MREVYNLVNKALGVVLIVVAVVMYTIDGIIIWRMWDNTNAPFFIAEAIGVAIVAVIGTFAFCTGVIVYQDKSDDLPEWMWMRYG